MNQKSMSDQERNVIERLRAGHDETWGEFIETVAPDLYEWLLEVTNRDLMKSEEYLGRVLMILARTIGKIK